MRPLYFMLAVMIASQSAQAGDFSDIEMVEVGGGAGFAVGPADASPDNFKIVPIFFRFGFLLNDWLDIDNHSGDLQLAVEPFANVILDPDTGICVGLTLFFHYSYPVCDSFDWYAEVGSGPCYFSVDTAEQGSGGFNFLNQVGTGGKWFYRDDASLNLGYRYRHASHAGIRGKPNGGIDTHTVVIGWSRHY